jgi:hypothetical protein
VVTEIGSGVLDLLARPGALDAAARRAARWLGGGGRSDSFATGSSSALAPPSRASRFVTGSRGSGLVGRSESVGREGGGNEDGSEGGGGCEGGGSDGTLAAWAPSTGPAASSSELAGAETDRERTSSDINDSKGPHRNESIPVRARASPSAPGTERP